MGRPRGSAEYRLTITREMHEREGRRMTAFLLQTARQFASFRYEISMEEDLGERTIGLTILGLRTPQLSLPSSGPAEFRRVYDHPDGTYEVRVTGLDGTAAMFTMEVHGDTVAITRKPSEGFLEVVTPARAV